MGHETMVMYYPEVDSHNMKPYYCYVTPQEVAHAINIPQFEGESYKGWLELVRYLLLHGY